MINDLELIQYSLELGLYLTRIMMEHSMFIASSLTPKEEKYIQIFQEETKSYQNILKELLDFANGKITKRFIDSNQLVTNYTIAIEEKTNQYFDIGIDSSITKISKELTTGIPKITKENLEITNDFNQKIFNQLLISLNKLNEIDIEIKRGNIFLITYPLTITHLITETNLFKKQLERLLNKEGIDPTYVYNCEYYYTNIMKDHGLLIRNFIDPIDQKNIDKATDFISLYTNILNLFNNDITPYTIENINEECQKITYSFGDFKELLTIQVAKNESYFIILPLFIDHLLRESYHFLSQLNYYENK